MNPQELRELIQELVQAVTLAIQSGEQLPDEFLAQVAQTLELMYSRLEEAEGSQGAQPITPPNLQNAPHASSQINAFKYDPKKQDLFIKYQGKYPSQNGPVYKYSNIPQYIYNVFSRGAVPPKTSGRNDWHEWKEGVTPSLGAAANALIKAGGFQYRKIS